MGIWKSGYEDWALMPSKQRGRAMSRMSLFLECNYKVQRIEKISKTGLLLKKARD